MNGRLVCGPIRGGLVWVRAAGSGPTRRPFMIHNGMDHGIHDAGRLGLFCRMATSRPGRPTRYHKVGSGG